MPLRQLRPGASVGSSRGDAVVVVPLYGAHDLFVRCLRSVLAHTPTGVALLVADDADPDSASRRHVEELDAAGALEGREVVWLRQPANLGFVGNCNAAFAATAPADVVLLNSDVEVAEGWLDGLRDAARSDSTIATATALANEASILSVPYRNRPVPAFPQTASLDAAAARVRARSPRLRPRLPTAIGHCVYVRRAAIDLVGGFDESFAPAYGEEVDFSQRLLQRGMQHVAADDVLVLHHGRGSLGVEGGRNPIQEEHERLIEARYPHYHPWVADLEADEHGPLARTLAAASREVLGRGVTIDARCLAGPLVGTQVLCLELIKALHRTGEVHVRALLPTAPNPEALEQLEALEGVTLVHVLQLPTGELAQDGVVHRPYQLAEASDLADLARLGARIVLTHQDLIAYRTPAYFPTANAFLAYRRLTREALAHADRTVFISETAARDAQVEGLVPDERVAVVPNGTDHSTVALGAARAPAGLADEATGEPRRPFLCCLGTDFRHKNRLFALELLAALHERHGWEGDLVLAGARVLDGSSAGDEAAWLDLHPHLAGRVHVLPAIDDPERDWLYAQAEAVVYPSTYEGFGFLPFEAADAGTACFFAHTTSMAETLAEATAVLVPWDAAASADRAIEVLRDPARQAQLVEEVRAAGRELTWDANARAMLAVYDDALRSRHRDVALLAGDALVTDARYWTLRTQIGDTGMSLVGPEPLLPDDVQNTLAGLAKRPATRSALLGTLRGLRRITGTNGSGAADGVRVDG